MSNAIWVVVRYPRHGGLGDVVAVKWSADRMTAVDAAEELSDGNSRFVFKAMEVREL